MKLGRNDPCWCGSGKKYKKCHLDRGKGQPVRPWEMDAEIRAESRSARCLHVGDAAGDICGKPAIGSHTVPRKMLKLIAKDGHVYRHGATIQDLEKAGGRLSVKRIGVNEASVVPVFCQAHDNHTFAPVEHVEFTGTREQCFLLAYRALCHEFSKKARALSSILAMRGFDRGKTLSQQVGIQMTMEAFAQGCSLSMRDMDEHKKQFDSLVSGKVLWGIP